MKQRSNFKLSLYSLIVFSSDVLCRGVSGETLLAGSFIWPKCSGFRVVKTKLGLYLKIKSSSSDHEHHNVRETQLHLRPTDDEMYQFLQPLTGSNLDFNSQDLFLIIKVNFRFN